MSDDSIFREVDEAVRQDQLKQLWDKFGLWIVAGAILIVTGVGGYKFWGYWQAEQAREAGARFIGGLAYLDDGKTGEALDVFRSLAQEGPSGYRKLSQFQLAALNVREGKTDEAVRIYDELAARSGTDDVQKAFAKIQAATLRLDQAPFDEMLKRLEPMARGDNPWRHSARELLGLSAYRTGDTTVAERYFNIVLTDQQTPAKMRQRAEMMLALLVRADSDAAPAGK